MWTYTQRIPSMSHDGQPPLPGGPLYSGHDRGLNNPGMEEIHGLGPIPRGLWTIGTFFDHPHLGPCVAHLMPVDHDAHMRTGFFIHGDNEEMDHSASDGCIVAGPMIRQAIRDSRDTSLTVAER